MTPEVAFGQVLMRVRREKGLSQEDLAFESKLNRTFISRLENGHRQPSLGTIFQLALAMGISASSLVKEVEALID